ncbi:Serine/threonine-protein kinase PknB [bacterium HR33]|nr:Serine/threonine-protein kinase PknB [bacterium HR33]
MDRQLIETLQSALGGRYRVEAQVGRGGMAYVFLAQDLKHDRRVAVKVLRPELASSVVAERFHREIAIAAQLSHPNILPLHDSGAAGELLYYVMPYVEGESLRDRLRREGQLPLEDAVAILREVADALAYAHSLGVVHRDIKPENILLHEGHAVVTDFGVARAVYAGVPSGITTAGVAVGTPAYMSPEQASGDSRIDARSDVYSLAVVFYEMLAGEPPYSGPTPQAILARQLSEEARSLTLLRVVTPALDAAIRKALARSPADRYATTLQFVEAVETALRAAKAPRVPVRALAAGAVVPAVLLAVAWLVWGRADTETSSAPSRARVTVLPFANLTPNEENRYFADGVTEEIVTRISRVPALFVVSSASVLPDSSPQPPLSALAAALGVDYILRGSVRRDRERVRITAQLVDAKQNVNVWAESYDELMEDIFAVQSEIATRVAAALNAEIVSSVKEHIARAPTADLVAYNLYLRGRYFWHRRTQAALVESARFFEQAVARDSGFARAWAGVADAYAVLAFYDYLPPATAYPKAKAAARRALQLDPSLGEAHASLGYIALYYDWDWDAAEAAFRRSIELDPNYTVAHQWYANYLVARGRFEEAAREMNYARELNPLSLIANGALGWVYFYARRYEDAIAQCDLALEMSPDWDLGHLWRGQALEQLGRSHDAIASLRRAFELSGRSGISAAALARAYATFGEPERARELLHALLAAEGYRPSYEIAKIYVALGEHDRAMDWLERAHEEHAHSMVFLRVDPQLEPLHGNARFERLAEKVGV